MARETKLERLSPFFVALFWAALMRSFGTVAEIFSLVRPVGGRPRFLVGVIASDMSETNPI